MTTTIGSNGTTVSTQLLDTMNGTSSANTASSSDMQSTFLQLLMAQLQNQDPTNPMDSSQMTSQLAAINTVTGINQLNTSISSLTAQIAAGQQPQAATLIGSNVLAPGSSVTVSGGAAPVIGVQFTNAASNVQVQVKNGAGQVVNTINVGNVQAGTSPIAWTATDANGNPLPDGNYTLNATGTVQGSTSTGTTLTEATVQSVVQNSDGTPGLMLSNGTTIGLKQVGAIL